MISSEKKMMEKFMRITNEKDENISSAFLNKYLYNLDNAIEAYFDNYNIDPCEDKIKEIEPNIEINEEKQFSIIPNFSNLLSFNLCKTLINDDKKEIEKLFKEIPSVINKKDLEINLKNKLCLFFLYDNNSIEKLKEIIEVIKTNLYINFKIENYCSIIKEEYKNSEIKLLLKEDVICPIIIFCHNINKEKGFNKNSIITVFDGKRESYDFPKFFIENLKQIKSNLCKNEQSFFGSNNYGTTNCRDNINEDNIINIKFIFPSGKCIEKTFLKNDTIETLYNYLISLGEELFSELDSTKFRIYINQPYTFFKEDSFKKTLREVNFNNNQIINIIDDSD